MRLTEHWPKATHLPHQPLQHIKLLAISIAKKAIHFAGEVNQNRTGFKQRHRFAIGAIGVDDRWDFVVRRNRQELR